MSDSTKFRSRVYVAIIYPDNPRHVECIEKLKTNGYNFAAILHDRDVYEDGEKKGQIKKPHWHIVVRFKNAVWNTAVAKELDIEPNLLEACKDADSSLLYLVHFKEEEKFQYEYEEVFGPMKIKLGTLLADTDEGTRALNVIDIIESSPGPIGYTELIRKAVAAGVYGDLIRMGSFATGAMREHNYEIYQQTLSHKDNERSQMGFQHFCENPPEMDFAARCDFLDKNNLPPKPLNE